MSDGSLVDLAAHLPLQVDDHNQTENKKSSDTVHSQPASWRAIPNHSDEIVLLGEEDLSYQDERTVLPSSAGLRKLSEEQKVLLTMVLSGESVFYTGCAGTGKSFVLGTIVRALRAKNLEVAVTASTGIAAVNIGGVTLNSFAGIQLGRNPHELNKAWGRNAKLNWRRADVLIIDEISMIRGVLFHRLEELARRIRSVTLFFSRFDKTVEILVLLVACNLCCVEISCNCHQYLKYSNGEKKRWTRVFTTKNRKNLIGKRPLIGTKQSLISSCALTWFTRPRDRPFVFQADCWKNIIKPKNVVTLTKVFRQSADEREFVRVLSELRQGRCSLEDERLLQSRVNVDISKYGSERVEATKLYPKNDQVDSHNQRELNKLTSPLFCFTAAAQYKPPDMDLSYLLKLCRAPELLELRVRDVRDCSCTDGTRWEPRSC